MCLFVKSMSRSVHEEHYEEEFKGDVAWTSLTVWRKSLLMNCKGFTVINSDGNLVYRVENYAGNPHEVILMDAYGKSILTMRRHKKLRLVDNWFVYEGEFDDLYAKKKASKKPSWCVRKQFNILRANTNNVLAHIFSRRSDKRHAYSIKGSYSHRSCKVLDDRMRVVAEIRKKEDIIGGISFGVEVFSLLVQPGFDSGFAMALILLLDQMFS